MFVQSKFVNLYALLCCGLISFVSVTARIVKPSHGVPTKYEQYQYQQQEQTQDHYQQHQEQPVYQHQAAPAKQASAKPKYSIGNHHSRSGSDSQENHDDHHSHPKYNYSYHVEDHKTGDYKQHAEERDGDVVHGEYSLVEADGSLRTVKYTVDKEHGFQAIVIKGDGGKKTSSN